MKKIVVGSRESRDCQIDSIAQSFAAFAPNQHPERAKMGGQSALQRLFDPNTGTTALLTPPFSPESEAGYISAYPEGVRENCRAIRDYFGYYETGRAADAVCDYIIERLGSREKMTD